MRTVLLFVAAVAVAGCATAAEPGAPAAPSSAAAAPQRPREVRLDGVDPCSLLTVDQRLTLGFETPPRRSTAHVELFRGNIATCTMIGFKPDAVGVGISTVTTVGIERWRESDVAARIRAISVVGFPAIVATPTQAETYCSIEIDVADGQLLDVQFNDGGREPPLPQAELCRRGEQTAQAAVTTLLSR